MAFIFLSRKYINVLDFLVILSYSLVTGDVLHREPLKLFDKSRTYGFLQSRYCPATGRLLDITHMCYEYRTPLLPGQLRQPRQSDLRVTSTLLSINRHNEYPCCSHPSRSYICEAHLLSRSDQWSDGQT